jgi:hypothetical protein
VFKERPDWIPAHREQSKPWLSRKGRRIDFALQDARNKALGRQGEEFVVELERRRLIVAKRDDLAGKFRWDSVEIGDGLGYDVLSFWEQDGSERLVEVKTTQWAKEFPFYVTATEVRCSEDVGEQFHLYRVFDFGREPRVYVLSGSLSVNCVLEAVQYRAVVG